MDVSSWEIIYEWWIFRFHVWLPGGRINFKDNQVATLFLAPAVAPNLVDLWVVEGLFEIGLASCWTTQFLTVEYMMFT